MRFLILTQYYPPEIGAPQLRLSSMARELISLGHQVEVVTAMPNYPTGKIHPGYRHRFYIREELDGVVVHRVWLYGAVGAGPRRMLNYLTFSITSLWGLWRSRRPDCVIVESPPLFLSVPGFWASRLWKAKMILHVADLWPDTVRQFGLMKEGLGLRLADRLEHWSYRKAYNVTAVTEGIRTILIEDKGLPESKVLFLPNGVDLSLFRPRPRDSELARKLALEDSKIILYAGNIGYVQGLETVLAASRLLSDRKDIVFVLIGDGSMKSKLLRTVQDEGLDGIKFLEPAPPEYVARLYSIASAGLGILRDIPLNEGARPSKIIPAMASGVPVLYSGKGEGARLLECAGAGLIVPPENPEALAEAARRLADDPELVRQLGEGGQKFAEENLSWPVLIEDWLEQLANSGGWERLPV